MINAKKESKQRKHKYSRQSRIIVRRRIELQRTVVLASNYLQAFGNCLDMSTENETHIYDIKEQ